ncbi:MAG: hypothetical protein FWG77_11105 [Treponema sp.]|nr:hypothetical protein [Treponema sp.]
MTITKQPLSPIPVKKNPIDPIFIMLESLEKLEAEMEDFEEVADRYFKQIEINRESQEKLNEN